MCIMCVYIYIYAYIDICIHTNSISYYLRYCYLSNMGYLSNTASLVVCVFFVVSRIAIICYIIRHF